MRKALFEIQRCCSFAPENSKVVRQTQRRIELTADEVREARLLSEGWKAEAPPSHRRLMSWRMTPKRDSLTLRAHTMAQGPVRCGSVFSHLLRALRSHSQRCPPLHHTQLQSTLSSWRPNRSFPHGPRHQPPGRQHLPALQRCAGLSAGRGRGR